MYIYLELTIYPAHPTQGKYSGLWFSYTLWHVAFSIFLQNSVGTFRSYGPLQYVTTSNIAPLCIFNTKHQYIKLFK